MLLSCIQLFAIPWTVAHQASLSIRFSKQEYWSGLPFPSPGDLPNPGIEPGSPRYRQMLYHLSHQGSPLYGRSMFNFFFFYFTILYWFCRTSTWIHHKTVFQSGYSNLHSHQQCMKVSIATCSHQHSLLLFWILATPIAI